MASIDTCDQITVAVVPQKFPDAKETFKYTKNVKLGALGDDDILISTEYVSVDPYLRSRLATWVNKPIMSFCVGKVVEIGKNVTKYKKDDFVHGIMPWQTYSIINSKSCFGIPDKVPKYKAATKQIVGDDTDNKEEVEEMIDVSGIPQSYYIGQFGMPGMTAYYGLYEKGRLKSSDSVLVSGGAGAVGAMVGQFARLKGCKKIVGTAGSQEKCDFMKSIGFTDVINYKEYKDTESMQNKLKEVFGKGGIDVYFDNTGGHVTNGTWDLLNRFGRVIVCGQISMYNSGGDMDKINPFLIKLIYKEVDVRGILVSNFKNQGQFFSRVGEWIVNKDVTIRETVVKGGLSDVPQAFCDLFVGKNVGKMVVDMRS